MSDGSPSTATDRDGTSASFVDAYRAGELNEFFELAPDDLAGALERPRPVDRDALVAALRRQADRFGAPRASREAAERLAHPHARAVVTGQQAGVLLGPSYTLSKAVSAVKLAARLDAPERPVVPVFWIASQDHDTAEIDHAWILDRSERLARIGLDLPGGVPAGRAPLPADAVERIERQLAPLDLPSVRRTEVRGLLRRSAAGATDPATLFGRLLAELLGPAGLVLFDPMGPGAAELALPLLRAELDDPEASVAAVTSAAERLAARGWRAQLGRADDATNLFLERPGAVAGDLPERTLLRRGGGGFVHAGARLDRSDVEARLEADPASLTPAAALRPVLQDAVLPTAASVVGPGELRYIAQLRGVYERHGVAMPLVWPRAEATVLEPPVRRILAKYDLDPHAFRADPDGAEERILLERAGHAERFERALARLSEEQATLRREVGAIDPTLERTVDKQARHVERAVRTLRRKSARALADRDDVTRAQFERLRRHLLPNGAPQERVLSPFSFVLKFGVDAVVTAFLELEPTGETLLEL